MEYFKNNLALIHFLKSNDLSKTNWIEQKYLKEQSIINEFEKSDRIYFMNSGVGVVEILGHEKQYISSFIFENDLFGLDSFSTFKQKAHSIRIISDQAVIFSIKKEHLLAALNQEPTYYEMILTNFADILQRHYTYFDFLHLPTTDRVKQALTYLNDRIGVLSEEEIIELPKYITQDVLAKFCRTSQSRISVCLTELHVAGWLKKKTVPITLNDCQY